MALFIGVSFAANLTPYGWAADAVLAGIAYYYGGLAAIHALGDFAECVTKTANAQSEQDLEAAASALARAVAAVGVVGLMALLHKVGERAKGGGGGAAERPPELPVGKMNVPLGPPPEPPPTLPVGKMNVPLGPPPEPPPTLPMGKMNTPLDRAAPKPPITAKIGHPTPWGDMTTAERNAFKHSYHRHGKELGLPNWSEKNAASLQEKFNSAVGRIRDNGREVPGPVFKPLNGKSVEVKYFEFESGGTRYYYYEEASSGKFISAGKSR
jgi:hypothetical protein